MRKKRTTSGEIVLKDMLGLLSVANGTALF